MTAYAELHCLSNFTFLRGASHPEELVERAAKLGYAALALTDECSVAGVVRAHVAAKPAGLKLIVGSEIRLEDGPRLVVLAANRQGYGELCRLITVGRRSAPKGRYRLTRADLQSGLPGCLAILLPENEPDPEHAAWLQAIFPGRAWLAVELFAGSDDRQRLAALTAHAEATGLAVVATGDVHMHVRARCVLQDTVTAIRLGRPVKDCGHALFANGERHLRPIKRLAGLYPATLLAESVAIAERCDFSLDSLRYEYPAELVPPGTTPAAHLRALTEAGLGRRFPDGVPAKVRGLIEHELALIAELGYEHYFLTVHDIVDYARGRAILCQGRGSAANSAVCYALGITEVDPSRMAMLFERFISRERDEPPDIDVDFEHERREEVIQYLYRKYGRDRAALAATVITYRPRSALRDVGKALGFDLAQVDRLAKAQSWWDGRKVKPERLAEAGFDPAHRPVARLIDIVGTLVGFPRHLSQHVGGFVISRGPLAELVPVENAAMAERTVIQWDKDDLDALGLLKVDVLALGMLSAIRRSLDLVASLRGRSVTMQDIPAEDPAVYAMIGRADTVGVFQIESRAQMAMLPRLKPRRFYDLVIEVAIVRPGPIQGGMVHPYLRRRQGLEPVTYPSEAVREVLERTLGVPIFQEQVMQLAVVAAGFTPGEADRLRRSMAAWRRRGGLEGFEERLISGMQARGYATEFAQAIYRQILGFGEYGFPESHAASFALLVYVSAWLKCHEPAAFACALLNSQPMGFYSPDQILQDARRHGIELRPVDVAASHWECTLEPAGTVQAAIRLGLRQVKGMSAAGAERLVAARASVPYADVADLVQRGGLDRRDLQALATAGALQGLSGHRRNALWDVAGARELPPLFQAAGLAEADPALPVPSEGEDIVADYASLGFTLGRHPLALLRRRLSRMRLTSAADIRKAPNGRLVRTSGIVTGRQRPDTASGVIFVTLEDETGMINVVVWRDLAERQRRELLGASLLGVQGVIERQGEVVHVMARRLVNLSGLLGELTARSRDFR
ncbi:error-prone DNA polymerase [Parasulfuritortus cantonensis]|uniref:Error-prone DNA polymerase n=1 Tax=Parasulfuritortus cantonensis TaxID=2528202 RepID=A0A4R1BMG7_9PROT|nr:error-prone DNA polymerase [Parasulfuritortus cantonensis]TCJ18536.1 error-prone DNA polymerase [Parasulfuritortus cantonensis]